MAERVEIIISATDNASGVVRKITTDMNNAFKGMGGSITNVGNQISGAGKALAAWSAPIGIIGGLGIKTFADFEDILAEIAARTGATGDQMDSVKQKALDMGAATVFSGTQSADAMLQLLASGFDLEETFAALPAVLDAAAAGALDLGYTADVVTDALAMWNLGAEDAMRVSDALARGAGASSAEINDLAQGLSNVGPIAAEFGLSIEDTVAVLAAFSERGIKGAEAGTQLRSMMTAMTKTTPKVTATWEALGISMFNAKGEMRPLETIMAELSVAMADMTDQERITTIKTLGGAYGQMGLSVLTSSDAIGDMTDLMGLQADAATVAQARMGTLRGIFDSVKGSIESLMINALEPFIENTLKPLGEQLIVVFNRMNDWTKANPKLVTQIVKMGTALVAAGPILFGVGKAIALVGMAVTAMGSPIALAVIATGALVSMFKDDLLRVLDDVWVSLADVGSGLLNMINALSEMGFAGITTLEFWYGLNDVFGSDIGNKLHELSITFYELYLNFKLFVDGVLIPFISQHSDTLIGIFTKLGAVLAGGVIISSILSIGAAIMALINPVTLTIAAVVLLWQAWENNFMGIRDFTHDKVIPAVMGFISVTMSIWKAVKPELEKLAKWFVQDALPAIVAYIQVVVIPALTLTVGWLKKLWDDTKLKLQELALWFLDSALPAIRDFIVDIAIPAIQEMITFLSNLWDVVGPKLQQLGTWFLVTAMPEINRFLLTSVLPTIGWVVSKLVDMWDVAGPKLQEFYNWVSTSFKWLLDNVFTPVYNVITDIVDAIGDMVDAIGDIDLGFVADIAGFFGGIIPEFASGGSFSGLASVGEQGREYVYAPGGAMVLPNGLTEQLMAGQGNTYNLNTSTSATSAGVEQDFRMMEAFAG